MTITKQDVFNAATAIAARGSKPTLNEVRLALGGGSFSEISNVMSEWRTAQEMAAAAIAATVRTPAPLAIANRLNDLADEVWEMAWQIANERLQGEYTTLQQAKCDFAQLQQETAELADAVTADLEIAQSVIKQQNASAAAATMEIDALNLKVCRHAESLTKAAHDAQLANAVLAEAHQRVEQLTTMLDSEKAERISASKKLEQSLITIAELNGNVTELAGDLEVMSGRATVSEAKSNKFEQAVTDLTKKLDKTVAELQVWQNKLNLADAQMLALKQQINEAKDEAKWAIEAAAELRGKLSVLQ